MNDVKNGKLRYEILTERLEEYLKTLPFGGKLPPVRSMMEQFKTSQVTVDRSLRFLEEKQLIERINGRGYFRKDFAKAEQRAPRIDFCFFLKKDVLSNPLFSSMTDFMLKEMSRQGCFMNIFAYDTHGSMEDFRERLLHNKPDVLFMLACSKVTFGHVLKDLEIPFIQIYPNMIEADTLSYIIDNEKAIRIGVEHLYEQGHRRIAYLHGQGYHGSHMLDQEERLEAFYKVMEEKDLPTGGQLIKFGGFSPEEGYAAALELLNLSPNLRPTAIFGNDYNAPGIYRAAREKGLRIPEDLSVVGFDNLSVIQFLEPPLTTIDICCESMLKELAQKAHQMARTQKQECGLIRTNINLIPGKSVTTCNNSVQYQKQEA